LKTTFCFSNILLFLKTLDDQCENKDNLKYSRTKIDKSESAADKIIADYAVTFTYF